MAKFTYGDLKDDIYLKPFLPLLPFLWKVYEELGWEEGVDNYERMGSESIFKFFETRLNESIQTCQDVLNGKFTSPEKVLSYIIMIPSIIIRSDLVIGTQKLFGGESCDITFATVHDYDAELLLLLNCHIEDGVPVDWYMVRQEDDILDRRHMKFGYKLREIPKKLKNMNKAALMLKDVLKDIRNERSPEWAHADYFISTVVSSWAIDLMCQPSNYESIASTYDGWASKEKYGLPDYTFALHPFPSAMGMFFYQGRSEFTKKLCSLTNEMKLYLQPWEPYNYEIIKTNTPGLFGIYKKTVEEDGIPFPSQTIKSEYPNLKSSDMNIKFNKKYPKGETIKPEHLNMDLDEFLQGMYFNIDHETKPHKIDKSEIISLGIGRNTKFV